jgi:probable rRNA maturation factor
MAELHSTSLGKAGSTDVLSFPIEHLTPGEVATSSVGPVVAGDVVLAPEYIRRQAADLGVDELDEFALMVTHGVLHCLGYDHDAEADAVLMEGRERELLARWGRSRR